MSRRRLVLRSALSAAVGVLVVGALQRARWSSLRSFALVVGAALLFAGADLIRLRSTRRRAGTGEDEL